MQSKRLYMAVSFSSLSTMSFSLSPYHWARCAGSVWVMTAVVEAVVGTSIR